MLIHRIAPRNSHQGAFAISAAFRRALCALAAAPLLFAAPAHAQRAVYEITGVEVDSTARTAAAARMLAIDEGHGLAFQRLLRRLLPRESVEKVSEQSTAQIAALVSNFEVEQEKTSSVRYLAKLTFRFKRRAIRNLLREQNLPFAESMSRPVLILPIYRAGGLNLLWDKPNPWLKAWADLPDSDGLVPIVIPGGDLRDKRTISAAQALGGNFTQLGAIARRYNAVGVIVAVAMPSPHPEEGNMVLQVGTMRIAGTQQAQDPVQIYPASAETPTPEELMQAAMATVGGIQEGWKAENLLSFDNQNEITVTVPLGSLSDWVRMEKLLARVSVIQKRRLLAMTRTSAIVRLSYLGEQSRLRVALARGNLQLQQGAADWILRPLQR